MCLLGPLVDLSCGTRLIGRVPSSPLSARTQGLTCTEDNGPQKVSIHLIYPWVRPLILIKGAFLLDAAKQGT